jgi:general secretion pathway protein B
VPAPAAPAAAETRLLTPAELPADIRSKLPALTVGGSMYSPTAKNRMVILNGQVFREGDKPADGLSVEEIRLKSTVLAFRGLRFELKH